MKKSLVVVLIFILNFFLAGCTELKQNQQPSGSKIVQTKEIKKDHPVSSNYYYLESRIHIKNKEYEKAAASLETAIF